MRVFFMGALLDTISQGKFFRRVFAIVLRTIAVLLVLVGLRCFIGVILVIGYGMSHNMPASLIFGAILFLLVFMVALYMVILSFWIRANDIANLEDEGFTMIPILSIFFKLVGEISAWITVTAGIQMGLITWFIGQARWELWQMFGPVGYGYIRALRPMFSGDNIALPGIIEISVGLLTGILTLAFFYLLSEMTLILADIALNIRALRRTAYGLPAGSTGTNDVFASATPVDPEPMRVPYCSSCGVRMEPGQLFCEACGSRTPDPVR